LTQEKLWTNQEKLHELLDVTVDELNAFVPMMLNQLHMEGLVHGNISAQGAVDLANIVSSAFQAKPITKQERLGARHIMLPENSRYVYEHPVPDPSNVNSSLEYLVQVADITDKRKRALVNLLAQIAREPCFDQLRTKEQLGYIVFSGLRTLGLNTGFRILLQSERDTCFLEQRVEAFLLQLEDIMANMTDEEFASNVSAVIFKKLEKDKNLFNEANRLWSHIHSGFYDFMQNEQDVAELQTISKQELVDFYRHYVHPGSPHLKKLSVHIGSQVQSMSEPWTHVHNCLTAHGLDISPQDVHAAMTTLSLEDAVKQLANGCTPEQLEQLHAQINAQISMEPVHPESTRKELLDKNELVVDAVAFKAKLQLTQAPYPMAEHGLHKL
jgi:insulysin